MERLAYRLEKSVRRLVELFRLGAPDVVKRAELTVIEDICAELAWGLTA